MSRLEFLVPDMSCEGCERAVREALEGASGVADVAVGLEEATVVVEYDPDVIDETGLADRVREAGFSFEVKGREERASQEGEEEKNAAAGWYTFLVVLVAVLAVAAYAGYALYPRFDLPAAQGAGLLLLAAGAGVASFFSPCAFPLLVTMLARVTGADATAGDENGTDAGGSAVRRGVRFATALAAGAAVFLLIVGVGIGLGGGALFSQVTFTSTAGIVLRVVIGAVLILLGLIQLGVIPAPLHAVEVVSRPLLRRQAETRRSRPLAGGAFFGFGYLLAGFG